MEYNRRGPEGSESKAITSIPKAINCVLLRSNAKDSKSSDAAITQGSAIDLGKEKSRKKSRQKSARSQFISPLGGKRVKIFAGLICKD